MLRLVIDYGGSISAEHGVGRAKQPWLSLARSPADIATMQAIKNALDPRGVLSPGVLLLPQPFVMITPITLVDGHQAPDPGKRSASLVK